MNLKSHIPKDLEDSNVIFSLDYNLDGTSELVNGCMAVTKDSIFIYIDDQLKEKYSLDEFDEYYCEQLSGCSMAVGKKGDETTCLCAFSQEHFLKFAELCKILEFYKRTGEMVEVSDAKEIKCLKCGMPLDEGTKECPYCAKKSKLFLKLVKRMGPYKKYFFLALIFAFLWECVWVVMPYFQRVLIDDYIIPQNTAWNGLIMLGIGLIVLTLASGLVDYLSMKYSFKVALNMGKELREDVFKKSQELSLRSLSQKTAGELISRVSSDAAKLEDFVVANGKDLLVKIVQLIVVGILIFKLQWKLALLVVLPIPIVFLLVKKLFNVMLVRYSKVWRKMTFHNSTLHDILNGIRVVKSYGNEKGEIEKYTGFSREWAKCAMRAEIMWYLTIPVSEFIMTIGSFFVLYYGGKMVLGEALSLGMLVQFSAYVYLIYEPMRWFIQ
ncbi:MAG: ABC transporter ATP-binding protein, partial [Clostridiales bacterium]|nr:ABC transporter ATP-binding protein [Clostridiales bacterium]